MPRPAAQPQDMAGSPNLARCLPDEDSLRAMSAPLGSYAKAFARLDGAKQGEAGDASSLSAEATASVNTIAAATKQLTASINEISTT